MQLEFRSCNSQVLRRLPVTAVDVPPSSWKGRSKDMAQATSIETGNYSKEFQKGINNNQITNVSDGVQRSHPVQVVMVTRV